MTEPTRRSFLLMSIAFLTGCATDQNLAIRLPGPPGPWDTDLDSNDHPAYTKGYLKNRTPVHSNPNTESPATRANGKYLLPAGIIARNRWAKGALIPARMNKMTTIKRITVHHDGMNAFYADSVSASRGRLDSIRRGHLGRGWGDVGYHYIIDRAGRIYEGRPINYQGAHVKFNNPGNLGIMCMGNFEKQSPTIAQLTSLNRFLSSRMKAHAVPTKNVFTHQELRPTACPGKSLQRHMVTIRHNGTLRA